MSIRNIFAACAIAALGAPLLADIPDGHGGRTSLQASPRPAVAIMAHACCPRTIVSTPPRPISAAERKVIGEVAWDSRYGAKTAETLACSRATSPARVYSSPAELKAVGHLNRTPAAASTDGTRCCDSGSCPMRHAS